MAKLNLKNLQNGSDIRGNVSDVTPEVSYYLAMGFCGWLSEKTGKMMSDLTVSIGCDPRLSSEELKASAISAMTVMRGKVFDCGLASTPAMFMSTVFDAYKCDGAIMITASHLPADRNGLKFFDKDGSLNKDDIADIINRAELLSGAGHFAAVDSYAGCASCGPAGCPPQAIPCDLMDTYAAHLQKVVRDALLADESDKPLEGLKIVVDAGNGSGGFFADKVLAPLGADISESQFLQPDGNFPNHAPNPENRQALKMLSNKVKETGADFGIIFDTDVDRIAAVDENGNAIARNSMVALAAVLASEGHPDTTIVTDSITSDPLAEFLTEELKVKHLRYMRGYKNVIDKAIELNANGTDCQLAIETSGHAAFKENYFLDDGAYLAAKIAVKVAKLKSRKNTLSSVVAALKNPKDAMEVRFAIKAEDYAAYGQMVLDEFKKWAETQAENGITLAEPNYEGVRLQFDREHGGGWALLRMSLHEAIMPLNMESDIEDGCCGLAYQLKCALEKFDQLDTSKF